MKTEAQKARKAITDKAWRERNAQRKKENDKAWRENNKEKHLATVRASKLLATYGITQEQFNDMLAKQGHVCKICLGPQQGKVAMAVDHCHTTGVVRGLLCNNCNRALGLLQDNPELMYKAIEYLKSTSA